jgi:tetratricopeptide (TPR) repeat protein
LLQLGEAQLQQGRVRLDEQMLIAARKSFTDCIEVDSTSSRCFFDRARAESYLEQVKQIQKDKKAAERWNDSAIDDAQHAVKLDDSSSDAHALLADLYGTKIGFGGMLVGPRYGPKANAENERALQLNPGSSLAYVVMGHKYLFTPKMFGGNIDKAVESFKKAVTLDPSSDEAFAWLAIAERKKGDSKAAAEALAQALLLNPESAFAKRIQSGAEQ